MKKSILVCACAIFTTFMQADHIVSYNIVDGATVYIKYGDEKDIYVTYNLKTYSMLIHHCSSNTWTKEDSSLAELTFKEFKESSQFLKVLGGKNE
ncbi:MAG: hypothetical protein AB7R69_05230 [Candidatus Babeliales bacterium]